MTFYLLEEILIREGASLAGVGDLSDALPPELSHLNRGISIAVRKDLNSETVGLLLRLQGLAENWLRERGFRFFSIPPDSDRRNGKFASRLYDLFSHKTAATCAGLGWIGKNGLVINKKYGPKLSWATVLTDAPFTPGTPITESLCSDCNLCVSHCPSGALTGRVWSRKKPFIEVVRYEKCRSLKKTRILFENKPNCGLCVNICPFARKVYRNDRQEAQNTVAACFR